MQIRKSRFWYCQQQQHAQWVSAKVSIRCKILFHVPFGLAMRRFMSSSFINQHYLKKNHSSSKQVIIVWKMYSCRSKIQQHMSRHNQTSLSPVLARYSEVSTVLINTKHIVRTEKKNLTKLNCQKVSSTVLQLVQWDIIYSSGWKKEDILIVTNKVLHVALCHYLHFLQWSTYI